MRRSETIGRGTPEVTEPRLSREEFQRALFNRLQELDFLTKHEEDIIVDLEKFRKETLLKHLRIGKVFYRGGPFESYLEEGVPHALYQAFQDTKVVSKEDWEQGQREGKPLFYAPETSEEVFNPGRIRKQDFYLGFWELPNLHKGGRELKYPSSKEPLQFNEVSIAALLYHSRFGDAQRDEAGRLLVKDPHTKAYQPITKRWFAEMGYKGGDPREAGSSLDSPREYLPRFAPTLIEQKLLMPNDFQGVATGIAKERRVERTQVSPTGTVMIRGVLHYLGREFIDQPVRIYEIASGVGGIIQVNQNGKETIASTFTIYKQGDRRVPFKKFGVSSKGESRLRQYAGAELIHLEPYKREEFFKRRPAEDDMTYQNRLLTIDNFESVLALSHLLWKETQVNFAMLPYEEQARLANIVGTLAPDIRAKLPAFVKEYGIEGLRSFLSIEHDHGKGARIFSITEKFGPPVAREIFAKYSEILNVVNQAAAELADYFTVPKGLSLEAVDKIGEELSRRAKEVLVQFANMAKGKPPLTEILQTLIQMKKDILLFTAIFKTVSKELGGINLNEIKNLSLATKEIGQALAEHDKKQMLEISRANWEKRPGGEKVVESFARVLAHPENNRFYIVRHREEIIGFMRFEPREKGRLYWGSVNIDPRYRGSAIGEAMMKILDKEAKDNVLEATVRPELEVGSAYIEKTGFVASGFITKDSTDGQQYFKIERDDIINPTYSSRDFSGVTAVTIKKKYTTKYKERPWKSLIDVGTPEIIQHIDLKDPQSTEMFERLLNQEEYVITRLMPGEDQDMRYVVFEKRKAVAKELREAA